MFVTPELLCQPTPRVYNGGLRGMGTQIQDRHRESTRHQKFGDQGRHMDSSLSVCLDEGMA